MAVYNYHELKMADFDVITNPLTITSTMKSP